MRQNKAGKEGEKNKKKKEKEKEKCKDGNTRVP